jgi:hypothetical protein
MGQTDISFKHNTHTSSGMNVKYNKYTAFGVQKLERKLVATLSLIHWIANCGVSWPADDDTKSKYTASGENLNRCKENKRKLLNITLYINYVDSVKSYKCFWH